MSGNQRKSSLSALIVGGNTSELGRRTARRGAHLRSGSPAGPRPQGTGCRSSRTGTALMRPEFRPLSSITSRTAPSQHPRITGFEMTPQLQPSPNLRVQRQENVLADHGP